MSNDGTSSLAVEICSQTLLNRSSERLFKSIQIAIKYVKAKGELLVAYEIALDIISFHRLTNDLHLILGIDHGFLLCR